MDKHITPVALSFDHLSRGICNANLSTQFDELDTRFDIYKKNLTIVNRYIDRGFSPDDAIRLQLRKYGLSEAEVSLRIQQFNEGLEEQALIRALGHQSLAEVRQQFMGSSIEEYRSSIAANKIHCKLRSNRRTKTFSARA